MRRFPSLVTVAGLALAACGGGTPPPTSTLPNVYELRTPRTISILPGEEKTFCYYTTLSNLREIGVKRWESEMTPGSHHMIVYMTQEQTRPDGTLEECGIFGNLGGIDQGSIPVWAFASQEQVSWTDMPEGVGMSIGARQPLVVQMHYLNASGSALVPEVHLKVHAHERDDYTPASVFVTYDTNIRVPPQSDGEVSGECRAPVGGKFFAMSTHSHWFTNRAQIMDGEDVLVDTGDWEHPEIREWKSAPFYEFKNEFLKYRCTYSNPTGNWVRDGDSAETDEMCMAVGYFFPATGMHFCLNGFVLPF